MPYFVCYFNYACLLPMVEPWLGFSTFPALISVLSPFSPYSHSLFLLYCSPYHPRTLTWVCLFLFVLQTMPRNSFFYWVILFHILLYSILGIAGTTHSFIFCLCIKIIDGLDMFIISFQNCLKRIKINLLRALWILEHPLLNI